MKRSLIAVLSLLIAAEANAIEPLDNCIALVADLRGSAVAADRPNASRADQWPVRLLQCFPARKVMTLQPDAAMTLFYPATGEAIELRGPGSFELGPASARALNGAATPDRSKLNQEFRQIKLDRSRLSPAGVRMRDPFAPGGVVLLEPRGVLLSEGAVVFKWEPVEGASQYRLQVANSRRVVLFEADTSSTELALPQARLMPGERLVWQVEAVSPGGNARSRWQEVVIASAEARALAAEIDTGLSAPSAAERNLREVLLLQRMMMTEKTDPW